MPRARDCTLWLKHSNEPEPTVLIRGGITQCRAWLHGKKMDLWREGYQFTLGSNYSDNHFTLTRGDLTAELYIEEKGKRL